LYVETVRTQKMVGFQTGQMMPWMYFTHSSGLQVEYLSSFLLFFVPFFVLKSCHLGTSPFIWRQRFWFCSCVSYSNHTKN